MEIHTEQLAAFDRLIESLGSLELYIDEAMEMEETTQMDPWLDEALEVRVGYL